VNDLGMMLAAFIQQIEVPVCLVESLERFLKKRGIIPQYRTHADTCGIA
jgi:hypothetical protein